jgi:hypothetical protein
MELNETYYCRFPIANCRFLISDNLRRLGFGRPADYESLALQSAIGNWKSAMNEQPLSLASLTLSDGSRNRTARTFSLNSTIRLLRSLGVSVVHLFLVISTLRRVDHGVTDEDQGWSTGWSSWFSLASRSLSAASETEEPRRRTSKCGEGISMPASRNSFSMRKLMSLLI